MTSSSVIGFGGGCHWCTEAVFQSLKGVEQVAQGWIASKGEAAALSEAVIVEFDTTQISLEVLIEIHLQTHKSGSAHSMRNKYRSAIYYFDEAIQPIVNQLLKGFQVKFDHKLITQVLPYVSFKPSRTEIENYYFKNPEKPFCKTVIDPKLKMLLKQFSSYTAKEKLTHLYSNIYEPNTKSKRLF